MRKDSNQSEYGWQGEEFTLPPEQPETLTDRRRYPGSEGEAPSAHASVEDTAVPSLTMPEKTKATSDAEHAAARKTKRKRTLLLQFAAVAATVVLVNNSFGIDFLGLDGLFNDSVITGHIDSHGEPYEPYEPDRPNKPSPSNLPEFADLLLPVGGDARFPTPGDAPERENDSPHNRYIAEAEFAEGSMGEFIYAYNFAYVDPDNRGLSAPLPLNYGEPAVNVPEDGSIVYDSASNTLFLRDYHGQGLLINRMGGSFTIHLDGENRLDQYLMVVGGSLRLSGGGILLVNESRTFDYGVYINGQSADACLMIEEDTSFDFSGKVCAIGADATCADKFLWMKTSAPYTETYQARLKPEYSPVSPEDSDDARSWHLSAGETAPFVYGFSRRGPAWSNQPHESDPHESVAPVPAAHGLPIGLDKSFPILPNPLPNASVQGRGITNEDYILVYDDMDHRGRDYVYINSRYPGGGYPTVSAKGLSYDATSNTLTMNNYRGGVLEVSLMGNSLRIELIGENTLDHISVYGYRTGGSLTFTGKGSLTVNQGQIYGPSVEIFAQYSTTCIMIEKDVTLNIFGGETSAVYVYDTDADKMFYYLSDHEVPGIVQESVRTTTASEFPGRTFSDWTIINANGGGASHIWFSPDGSEPPLPGGVTPPDEPAVVETLPIGFDDSYPKAENGILSAVQLHRDESEGPAVYNLMNFEEEDFKDLPGIYYDKESLILYLTDYKESGYLQIELAKSGIFTIVAEGENNISGILLKVYDSQASDTTGLIIEGTGSLYLEDAEHSDDAYVGGVYGIRIEAGGSQGYLAVGNKVDLTVCSSKGAIHINNSSAAKGIYYLSEEQCVEGAVQVARETDSSTAFSWTVVGGENEELTEIHFIPTESEDETLPIGFDINFPAPEDGSLHFFTVTRYEIRDGVNTEVVYQPYIASHSSPYKTQVDGIVFDDKAMTLRLTDYQEGGWLHMHITGGAMKLIVEGSNRLNGILLTGDSAEEGSTLGLIIEGHGSLVLEYSDIERFQDTTGIRVSAANHIAYLAVGDKVDLKVSSDLGAIVVSGTMAPKGIYYLSEGMYVAGARQRPEKSTRTNGYDWTAVGEADGEVLTEIHFIPTEPTAGLPPVPEGGPVDIPGTALILGQDRSMPDLSDMKPDLSVACNIQLVSAEAWYWLYDHLPDNSTVVANPSETIPGIQYDPESNTLTLRNYQGGGDLIAENMGNLTIVVEGYNELDSLYLHDTYGEITVGAALTLKGSGTLIINKDSTDSYGIYIDAGVTYGCLMIDPAVTIIARGSQAAITVTNTFASKGIYYTADTPAFALLQYSEFSQLAAGDRNWYVANFLDHTMATEAVFKPGKCQYRLTTTEEIDLSAFGQPAPEKQEGQDYDFIIAVRPLLSPGTQYIYSTDPTDPIANIKGLSYDPSTNTLTMENYDGSGLELFSTFAKAFTLRLIGENKLQRLDIGGMSDAETVPNMLFITGSGSLTLSPGRLSSWGLRVGVARSMDPSAKGLLIIDKDVTLELYGTEGYSPLEILHTTAAYPLIHLGTERSAEVLCAVSYYHNYEQYDDVPHIHDYVWGILDAETEEPLTHVIFGPGASGS